MRAVGDNADHVALRPAAEALTFSQDRLDWRTLDALQRRIATRLRQGGARSSVALVLPHSLALAAIFLSAARLGLEVQILDTAWPEHMRQVILRQLDPDLVIRADDLGAPETAGHALDAAAIHAWCSGAQPLDAWPHIDPHASFYVGFTSGTTGQPKGYRRNHQSWLESFKAARTAFPLNEKDVVAAPGTLTHSLFLFALAYAMNEGSHCVMGNSFRPDHCLDMMQLSGASVLFSVPVQLGLIARHGHDNPIASLRQIVSSGSKFRESERAGLAARFPNARLTEFYGTSETSFISFRHVSDKEPKGCVGAPFPDVHVSIHDESGAQTPNGTTGRIHVKSDMLFSGYACGTEENLISGDGSIATEDCGYMDASGRLFLTGRHGRMIVTSAKNLFPEEVEQAIELMEGVLRAVVIGVPDDKRGERPVAFIECRPGLSVELNLVAAALRQTLPAFKIPRQLCLVTAWPLTRSGKIDYAALAELWSSRTQERG